MMKEYKKEFIAFLIEHNSLKFGEFKLKSGRMSPYFLNTGMLYSGEAVYRLGKFYAETIKDRVKEEFNVVFGPAYKGIPLAVSCASSLFSEFGMNKSYSFNRKESKDHGDASGLIVGKQLEGSDRIVLIDDVITAGTAIKETVVMLEQCNNPKIVSVVVSVDRMEKGAGELSAIQELNQSLGINFYPIVNIKEIIEYLEENKTVGTEMIGRMTEYRRTYGTD
ncbi:MAG: orotate phosphoribosyltransferase [Candidatus Delongbacteria bacterium]|nr:orotate phosphoribosyltransferase [Candidatus Delongbacteria bacterium]